MIIFTLLIFCVISLTVWLSQEIKAFTGVNQSLFSQERKIVVITSVIFCTGFLLQAIKNGVALLGSTGQESTKPTPYVCLHLNEVNGFQLLTYVFQDIVPIAVILAIHHKNFKEVPAVVEEEPEHILNSEGSDEIPNSQMTSLPHFDLSDGAEVQDRPSTTSLINQMVEKGFFDMEEARANRSSGSLVVQNVSNYGLISDKVVSQMMR